MNKKPLIIGHRGYGLGPENTIETFLAAIKQGAQMIELDVWLSRDAVPVVYHDEFLTSDGENVGRVAQYTVSELRQMNLPGGARIPTLEKVIEEILPLVPLNIELKFYDLNYRPLVSAVLKLIRETGVEKRVLISSFFHQSLEVLNWMDPTIPTAPVFGVPTGAPHRQDIQKLRRLKGWVSEIGILQPAAVVDYLMLGEEMVDAFKSAGLALVAYTVDESGDMSQMVELEVEGIITKRPALLAEVLGRS